ncbi:MAG: hypothetical protein OIF40_08200, partial [Mangrovicoccus sp.]|nr:hypothetical protein [Mangrovicoccus sp.]
MGFAVSLKRRYRLVQGEPFHRAISLFFGSRKTRRAVETQKFGRVLGDRSSPLSLAPNGVDAAQQARIAAILDENWYRERHALALEDDAMLHFCEQGLVKAYAPCPEMAAKDGLSLTHWAVEILIRNGIKV